MTVSPIKSTGQQTLNYWWRSLKGCTELITEAIKNITMYSSVQHHETNKEIPGMNITIAAIESCTDIPDCITAI